MPGYLDIGPRQTALIDISPLQSPSATTLSETLSDSLTVWTDGLTLSLGIVCGVLNDSLYFEDSIEFEEAPVNILLGDTLEDFWGDSLFQGSGAVNYVINDSFDSLFLDAILTPILQPAFLLVDSFIISDGFFPLFALNEVFNDSLSFIDGLTVQNLYVYNISLTGDILNIQDGLTVQLNTLLLETLNDSFTISDVLFISISIPLVFVDNLKNWIDALQMGGTNGLSILFSDYYIIGETAFFGLSFRFVENDAYNISDNISYSLSHSGNAFTDAFTISDGLLLSLSMPLTVVLNDSQSGNWADALTQQLPEPLNPYLRRYLNDVIN